MSTNPTDRDARDEEAEPVIVEREIVLPMTDHDTQAQDDMLVATGFEPGVIVEPAIEETQGERDMRVATGRTAPDHDRAPCECRARAVGCAVRLSRSARRCCGTPRCACRP